MADCKFRLGDKVWSPLYGNGVIVNMKNRSSDYPITAQFAADIEYYTEDGKTYALHQRPSLFFEGSYIVEAPEPQRKYSPKEGELVAVSYDKETWATAIFSHLCPHTGRYFATRADGRHDFYRYDFCEPVHNHFNIPKKEENE